MEQPTQKSNRMAVFYTLVTPDKIKRVGLGVPDWPTGVIELSLAQTAVDRPTVVPTEANLQQQRQQQQQCLACPCLYFGEQ